MKISNKDIKTGNSPYLIAEIGVNHFDIAQQRNIPPLAAAKKMVAEAATAGVDAVKFQSYSAERLASKNSPAYWDTDEEPTESQYELFSQYDDFGAAEFKELATWTSENHDVDFLSTPFDFEAIEYLEEFVPAYKIASADITNHPLLRRIAKKEKPILLSTGASTIGEIDDAVRVIESEIKNPEICLLHCILQYPTEPENANLGMIKHINDMYPKYTVGYSDHVLPDDGMTTLLNAMIQGAEIIEKHFTLNKSIEGNDHYHAMNPQDVQKFRSNANHLSATTGKSRKKPISAEMKSRENARRSLVAATSIEKGVEITREHIAIKRPGTGISPSMLDTVIGKKTCKRIESDSIISWDMV